MHTWVIGAGGLLGSALVRRSDTPFTAGSVPWADTPKALGVLTESLREFGEVASGEPWRILWAAGRATTAACTRETEQELLTFKAFVGAVEEFAPAGPGTFGLISSAGAVYAGSAHPPFSYNTPPRPLSAYGRLKLTQERVACRLSELGIGVVIARISNLYGPGQDLNKLQGIVSRLCWASISRESVNIFVPLDTLRDYIFVEDAAARILYLTSCQDSSDGNHVKVKIVASGRPMSLGHVINTVEDVLHMPIPVSFGSHYTASAQSRDLRLTPSTDEHIVKMPLTTFPAGVRYVFDDLLRRHQLPMRKV